MVPDAGADPSRAEDLATYAAIEILRRIVQEADANRLEVAADERLEPSDKDLT